MKVRLTEQSLEWLYDQRIFFQGFRHGGFRLKAGEFLTMPDRPCVEPYCAVYEGNQLCAMGSFAYSWSPFPIDFSVGRYCSIALDVKFPGPRHPVELLTTSAFIMGSPAEPWSAYLRDRGREFGNLQPNPQKKGTVIGNDVWIGQNAAIMRGLQIGDGAVIAASAVVTKDVPPYAIVGGNPARFIRWRFPQPVIEELRALRWWRFEYALFDGIDLSDVGRSIKDVRRLAETAPVFEPNLIDLSEMPHSGVIPG